MQLLPVSTTDCICDGDIYCASDWKRALFKENAIELHVLQNRGIYCLHAILVVWGLCGMNMLVLMLPLGRVELIPTI